MRRYLFISLLFGALTCALGMALHLSGVGTGLVDWVRGALARSPSFPATLAEEVVLGLQIAITALLAFGLAWTSIDISNWGGKVLVGVIALALTFTLAPTLALYGILFEPIAPCLAGLSSLVIGLIFGGTERGRRKGLLEEMLGHRVSKKTLGKLLAAKDPLELEGEDREVAILTCRIFNHQEMREKLDAAELVALTNMFLAATAEFLLDRGAYLDESAPDCIRVFFGIPEKPEAENASVEEACSAAIELRQRLENLAMECERRWMQKPQCGVAITAGTVTVGLYGSGAHTHYTGVGGQVDFCRRLCGVNAEFGSVVITSAAVYTEASGAFEFRPIERFYVPTQGIVTEVYELMADIGDLSEEEIGRRDAFWKGVVLYREDDFEGSRAAFKDAENGAIVDPPLQCYQKRIDERFDGGGDPDEENTLPNSVRASTSI